MEKRRYTRIIQATYEVRFQVMKQAIVANTKCLTLQQFSILWYIYCQSRLVRDDYKGSCATMHHELRVCG